MKIINKIKDFWKNNIYKSQVTSEINPFTSCAAHCGCWLLQNVLPFVFSNYTPDDYSKEINTKKYYKWAKKNVSDYAAKKYKNDLNQLWAVQEKFINDKLIENTHTYKVELNKNTDNDFIQEALNLGPVIINTSPIYRGRSLGHVMLIVGYNAEIDSYIIDDPFGDFRDNYRSGLVGKGNDLVCKVSEFDKVRGKLSITLY